MEGSRAGLVALAVLALALCLPQGSLGQSRAVGQVLRAQGRVELRRASEKARACSGLDQLAADDILVLGKGASATAVLYSNGARFALGGGSKVRIGKDSLKALAGPAPRKLKPVSRALVRPLETPARRLSPRFTAGIGDPRGGRRAVPAGPPPVLVPRDRSALSVDERAALERQEREVQALRETDPDDPSPDLLVAQVYERLALVDDACSAYEAALRLGPNPGAKAALERLRAVQMLFQGGLGGGK